MQILDTSVTNVALPHMQGSLSASLDEITWVLTSFIAANAVDPAGHRVAGRAPGPPDLLPARDGDVHGELAPLRRRAEPRAPGRRSGPPGPGRRPSDPPRAGDPARGLPAAPAWDGDGHLGARHHGRADRGPDGRRLDHRELLVALDLLHQPALRRARPGAGERVPDGRPATGRRRGPDPLPVRRARARAPGGGHRLAPGRTRSGRAARLVRVLGDHDPHGRGRHRAHGLRAVGASRRAPARRPAGPREPDLRARHLPHLRHRLRALLELPAPDLLHGASPPLRRAHRRLGAGAGRRGLADLAGDRRAPGRPRRSPVARLPGDGHHRLLALPHGHPDASAPTSGPCSGRD